MPSTSAGLTRNGAGTVAVVIWCLALTTGPSLAVPTDGPWLGEEEPVTVLGPLRPQASEADPKWPQPGIEKTSEIRSQAEANLLTEDATQNPTENELSDDTTTSGNTTGNPSAFRAGANGTADQPEEGMQEHATDPEMRLPGNMRPLHYVIKLQPFVNGNASVQGSMEVELEVLEPAENITLHSDKMQSDMNAVRLVDSDNKKVWIKSIYIDYRQQFLVLNLNSTLEANKRYNLSMSFNYYLLAEPKGVFKTQFKDRAGMLSAVASTLLQPVYARRAFPCFDEPGLKATFDIHIARETHMTAISNMPLLDTTAMEGQDGWVIDRFNTTVPMSTYQVAFVVSELEYLNCTLQRDVQIRVWARPEFLANTAYAQTLVPHLFKYLEDYLGIPYPLPKLDIVTLPSAFPIAFEAWGLIMNYKEDTILYDPATSSLAHKRMLATLLAHELAHQWFGNLVTPFWWTDFWLSEGFASYFATLALRQVEPSWEVEERMVVKTLQEVFRHDALLNHPAVRISTFDLNEPHGAFSRISYQKGESILRMMNAFLTEASFKKGIVNFLLAHKYKTATTDDLWHHLTTAAHQDGTLPGNMTVKMVMDTWTLQVGYPVVTVSRSPDGTAANVSQKLYLARGHFDRGEALDQKWWIPLTHTSKGEADFNRTQDVTWMKDSEESIAVTSLPPKDQWVIFNLRETGYYRVNYDDHNWNLLIRQLRDDHSAISVENQAQMADDAMNLGVAGELSFKVVLDLINALKNTSELNGLVVVSNIEYMNLMMSSTPVYEEFQRFLLSLLAPLYANLGLSDGAPETFEPHAEYPKLVRWACEFGLPDCVARAKSVYKQLMMKPENSSLIPEELKSTVLCTAIARGGPDEWAFAWSRYLKSRGEEKDKYLVALGCTTNSSIRDQYILETLGKSHYLPVTEAIHVLDSLGSHPLGGPTGWSFLQNHWDVVTNTIGEQYFFIKTLLEMATKSFNTEEQRVKVQEFLDGHVDETAKTQVCDPVISQTERNVAWMKRNYDVIAQWLGENGFSDLNI
ncbi:aminopeptidase N-like [Penaeus japonicus]|uniref:aminopeptidase N-like n=1 Tax=Penaeus japonicus TaxID=27405 RepID=UPI001C710B7C|nr:aminopeptidase N-like [Penaeus japonicus]